MPEVAKERTNWRDSGLSDRHRQWGESSPILDLDFIVAEYDYYKAIALVEYKHEYAKKLKRNAPAYRVLIDLANRARIPAFSVRYTGDYSSWYVVPLNRLALKWVPKRVTMSEQKYVDLLYRMRGREPDPWEALQ